MNSANFSIKELEGINFAKLSGDNNRIHIDKIAGYNSIYGHNIVHGVLIILRFLEKQKIKKNYSSIKIQFFNAFKYNSKIRIKKIKKKKYSYIYHLIQENITKACIELDFFSSAASSEIPKKKTFKKVYLVSKKLIKKKSKNLNIALYYLTKYVGTVFPGKNSLITEINIYINKISSDNHILIESFRLDKRFPFIKNKLKYKNYEIDFKTLIRPELNIKLAKPNKKILNEVASIKENILIIGGSSGIGNDLLKLFLKNKKIKIISTYFKNKNKERGKNLIVKKINILKNLNTVYKIIRKFSPIMIYYFPTPKIYFTAINDKRIIEQYKNFYIYIPTKIIKFSNNYESKFFYPSTTYKNPISPYSSIKLKAESELAKMNQSKTKINVLKIPGINTRQNLSLTKRKLQNFRELISQNLLVFNKVFFKN